MRRYCTTLTITNPPTVLGSYRWRWLADLIVRWHNRNGRKEIELSDVNCDPQSVIKMHHDHLMTLEERNKAWEELAEYQDGTRRPPVSVIEALYSLVARDDMGRWTTVHDSNQVVDPDVAATLDKVLA